MKATKRTRIWMLALTINLLIPNLTACSEEKSSQTPITLMLITIIGLLAIIAVLAVKAMKSESELKTQQEKSKIDLESQKNSAAEEKQKYEQDIEELGNVIQSILNKYEDDMSDKEHEIEEKQKASDSLSSEIAKMREQLVRLQKLHPELNFEQEIREMKEAEWKLQAEELDEKITAVILTPADRTNVVFFAEVVTMYEKANNHVKKYMISDVAKLNSLLEQSKAMKKEYQIKQDKAAANSVQEEIRTVLAHTPKGNYSTYEVLKNVYEKYEKLTETQKAFITENDAVSKLSTLVSVARNDYENFSIAKEAERKVRKVIEEMKGSDEETRVQQIKLIKDYYEKLSTAQKAYFSQDLLIFVNFWQEETSTVEFEDDDDTQLSKKLVSLTEKNIGKALTIVRKKLKK